jgi:hypothetical protein
MMERGKGPEEEPAAPPAPPAPPAIVATIGLTCPSSGRAMQLVVPPDITELEVLELIAFMAGSLRPQLVAHQPGRLWTPL